MSIEESNKLIAEIESIGYFIDLDGSVYGKTGQLLKTYTGTSGYIQFHAYKNGRSKTYLVHRLVALKYRPNPNNLPQVNHFDGNKKNNHYTNLIWVTRNENIQHGFDTGLITPPWIGKSGSVHPRSRKVDQCDSCGFVIKTFGSIREATRETGIKSIDMVLSGRYNSAGGYKWKYNDVN